MIVVQRLVDERLAVAYPDHRQVSSDGSVNTRIKTATAAYAILALNLEHAGRLHVLALSTTTELVAIRMALEHLRTLYHPSLVVLLTNSCSALLQ